MPVPLPIATALDGSSESELALQEAADIAKHSDAPLLVLSVVPPPMTPLGGPVIAGDWYEDIVSDYQSVLDRAAAAVAKDHVACETVLLRGPVVEMIVSYLDEHPARMVVVGARGRSALSRYFLGSVSEGLVHHAPCSILVVRPPRPPAGETKAGARSRARQ
jgi:nucleotide-binding universal stress UspA family protein